MWGSRRRRRIGSRLRDYVGDGCSWRGDYQTISATLFFLLKKQCCGNCLVVTAPMVSPRVDSQANFFRSGRPNRGALPRKLTTVTKLFMPLNHTTHPPIFFQKYGTRIIFCLRQKKLIPPIQKKTIAKPYDIVSGRRQMHLPTRSACVRGPDH